MARLLGNRFFGGELAVDHALDACDAVVVGDVDGADALGIAAERADVADPQVDRDALTGHNQEAVFGADDLGEMLKGRGHASSSLVVSHCSFLPWMLGVLEHDIPPVINRMTEP